MRPTCAGDSGPRSERAVLRHPIGAEAIDRANRTADAQYNRQPRARPHGECHNRRRRAQARIGAGYGVLGQAIYLPQYLVPYPNAHFPAPPRHSNAHFPAPPRHSNAHFPAPLRLLPPRGRPPHLGARQFRCRFGRWIQEQAVAARRIPFSLGCRCWHGETTWPMSARVRAPRTTGPFSQRYHDPRKRLRGAVPRSGSASLAKQLDRRPDRLALQYKTPPEGHKGQYPAEHPVAPPEPPHFQTPPNSPVSPRPAAIPAAPLERPRAGLRPRPSSEQRLLLNQERPAAPTSG